MTVARYDLILHGVCVRACAQRGGGGHGRAIHGDTPVAVICAGAVAHHNGETARFAPQVQKFVVSGDHNVRDRRRDLALCGDGGQDGVVGVCGAAEDQKPQGGSHNC